MNQRFNESKIENIPVFFSNLRQVKYLQAYLRDIRSLWLHSWLIEDGGRDARSDMRGHTNIKDADTEWPFCY